MFILACILRTFKPQTVVSAFLKKWLFKMVKQAAASKEVTKDSCELKECM